MQRHRTAAAVLAVLLLGSGASADPTNWGHLGQIVLWLQQIDRTLQRVNEIVEEVKGKLADVYPEEILRQIEIFFEPVNSIKQEVEKLACNWRFTPRVERLRLALFGGGSFCRGDWNLLFGPPTLSVDWDLESYYDWSAVRRLNLIKARNEKGPQRAEEAAWLAHEAIQGRDPWDMSQPYSPGYSQRLSALAAAQLGNLMVEVGDTQAAMLELDQEALNDRRRRRLLDHQAAFVAYADLAQRGRTSLPAPAPRLGERP